MMATTPRGRATILISLIAILGTYRAAGWGQTTKPVTLEGRVTAAGDKPVAAARIALYGDYQSQTGYRLFTTGTTDAQGKFRIAHESTSEIVVVVQSEGRGLCMVRVPGDLEDDPLEIPLKDAASVRIQVVNPDGSPAAGVRVAPAGLRAQTFQLGTLFPDALMEQLAQTSDASGYCTFGDLPRRTTINFDVLDERAVRALGTAQTTDAPTTDAAEPIHMQIGGIIEGRILLGDSGKPAAGVHITDQATTETGNRWMSMAQTDADGKFRMTHLRPGSHALEIRLEYPLNAQYAAPKLESFPLASGQTLSVKEIRLISGTEIHGKATIEGTGAPAVGAVISISIQTSERGSTGIGFTRVTADGTYAIRVLPGIYRISGNAGPERGSLVPTVQFATEFFTVEEGKDVTHDMTFQQNRAAVQNNAGPIKGIVADKEGIPIEGAQVTLSYGTDNHLADVIVGSGGGSDAPAMGDGSRTLTDRDGKFELPVAGNGALLRVRKGKLALPKPLVVGADRDLTLLLRDDTAGSAVVHVVGANAEPLASVDVIVRASDGVRSLAPRWGQTDANGTFTVAPVYPDRDYRVLVGGYHVTSGSANFKGEDGLQVDVPPITILKADSFITGTVISETGQPMRDVQVMISGGRGGSKSVNTGPDGRFRVDDLVPGETVSIRTNSVGSVSDAQPISTDTHDALIVHVPRQPPAARGSPRGGRAPATQR